MRSCKIKLTSIGEGRLISETDGDTGATQREYIWLGLTPVAIYDATNDNDTCDEALLATLQERLLARQDRLAIVTERITIVSGNLDTRTAREATVAARKAELEAILAGVNPNNTARIARLTERIATLETRLETIGGAIIRLTDRLETLNARVVTLNAAITRISARIARVQARCDAGGGTTTTTAQLYFLHADHLGRPAFATDSAGSVVWDGGITTPFGEAVSTAAAFAQNLMFPGQYQDAESGLSHNWHRTYDPTLGRYLQSDPIGLAGGFNRYAYVGGNPVRWVDPSGLLLSPEVRLALLLAGKEAKKRGRRTPWGRIWTAAFTAGAVSAGVYYTIKRKNCDDDPDDDCLILNQKIKALRDRLARRHGEMLEDKHNLPIQGPMSVEGHLQQFGNRQVELRRLLEKAAAKGCPVFTADAWYWATKRY